jgi:hypothetical protein
VEQELASEEQSVEDRVVATFNQVRCDLRSLGETLNCLFAFVDTLAKVVLRALPDQNSSSARMPETVMSNFLDTW